MDQYIQIFKSTNYETYYLLKQIYLDNGDSELDLVKHILYNLFQSELNNNHTYWKSLSTLGYIRVKEMIARIHE